MTTQHPTSVADIASIRKAIEDNDLALLTSLYHDDAMIRIVDKAHPPSSPLELSGKQAIQGYLSDVASRDMTHTIEREVVGADRISYTEACRYADGTRVLAATMLDLADGKIAQQTIIQAWDEA